MENELFEKTKVSKAYNDARTSGRARHGRVADL